MGQLQEVLERSSKSPHYVDVELFAGAGGMAIGLSDVGLVPNHLFEIDSFCHDTLTSNSKGSAASILGQVHREDVATVEWDCLTTLPVRMLAAGPPCQPFSLAGKHLAERDGRNEFPSTLRAIRHLRPACVMIENVHGLRRPSFRPYFDYVLRQLKYPSVSPRTGETWQEHSSRIELHEAMPNHLPEYEINWGLLNAADYGVAQTRSRVIIVAVRRGLPATPLPQPTHSMAALIRDQASGVYWEKHSVEPPKSLRKRRGAPGYASDASVERRPWRTVRDALTGLANPPPKSENCPMNHWLIPGARLYPNHNGSDVDWPSKTIKAGVHGVPGGENVLRLHTGEFRYYTLREMARLQGFPDHHYFKGPRSRVIQQIGNAMPCRLAGAVAAEFRPALEAFERQFRTESEDQRPLRRQADASKIASAPSRLKPAGKLTSLREPESLQVQAR